MTQIAIEAMGLCRSFGDEPAVREVDLAVHSGEIHALVGLNGAGKTTLMRMLLGMIKPDHGSARINGADVSTRTGWSDTGYLIETPFAYAELTVAENLQVAARLRRVPSDQLTSAVSTSIERFALDHWADRRAKTLSSGNRQRLGLATATVHGPSILILDEPANALDPAGVVFIRELLIESAAEGGAVLVSSHHLDEVARVADRITVVHRGSVVGTLDPSEIGLEHRFFELALEADLASGVAT